MLLNFVQILQCGCIYEDCRGSGWWGQEDCRGLNAAEGTGTWSTGGAGVDLGMGAGRRREPFLCFPFWISVSREFELITLLFLAAPPLVSIGLSLVLFIHLLIYSFLICSHSKVCAFCL